MLRWDGEPTDEPVNVHYTIPSSRLRHPVETFHETSKALWFTGWELHVGDENSPAEPGRASWVREHMFWPKIACALLSLLVTTPMAIASLGDPLLGPYRNGCMLGREAEELDDVDGDGVADLLVLGCRVDLISGRTGAGLWALPPVVKERFYDLEIEPVDDVDGDGIRNFVLADGSVSLRSGSDGSLIRLWPRDRLRGLAIAWDADADGVRDLLATSFAPDDGGRKDVSVELQLRSTGSTGRLLRQLRHDDSALVSRAMTLVARSEQAPLLATGGFNTWCAFTGYRGRVTAFELDGSVAWDLEERTLYGIGDR